MNSVFFVIIAMAVAVAGWRQAILPAGTEPMPVEVLGTAAVKAAEGAVTLGIELIGSMALFLGLMRVAERAGLMTALARLLRPLLAPLFPDVPADHPAMGAITMNIAANVLGLSNAATPFGVRAMQELDSLNPRRGTATDAMVLFLVINTANVTLLPTHVMALRAAIGSHDPAAVIPTTLFATLGSTLFAVFLARWGNRWFPADRQALAAAPADAGRPRRWLGFVLLAGLLALVPVTLQWGRTFSPWIIPGLIVLVLAYGMLRRVPVYEAFVEGARGGLKISVRIIPYLVAILVAVGMFRASGAMDLLIAPLGRLTAPLGLPPEAMTMAVLRSLSGSASFGYLAALLKDPAIGPDGYLGVLLSTIYGSSETTFYVLAVYFGAVGVRRIRHALLAGLLADLVAVALAVVVCRYLYG